jgi:uncharacterized protein YeeX (DUF496 family)
MKVQDIINNTKVKPAVLVNLLLMNNHYSDDQIFFVSNGGFNSGFKPSIANVVEHYSSNDSVRLVVNKSGLTDYLPDAFLYNMTSNPNIENNVLKQIEEEEKKVSDARSFFLPLDNAFSHLYLNNEIEEFESITGGYKDVLRASFFDFLYQHKSLSQNFEVKNLLFKMIPLSHKLMGDAKFLSRVYAMIFEVDVVVSISEENVVFRLETSNNLEQLVLGENTVLGTTIHELATCCTVSVAVNNDELLLRCFTDYFNEVLGIVKNYFLPLNSNISYQFKSDDSCLYESSYLGFNFQI